MEHYSDDSHINAGTGEGLSIGELAEIRDVVYREAGLRFDNSKPDGMPRKLLDVTRRATSVGTRRSTSITAFGRPMNGWSSTKRTRRE